VRIGTARDGGSARLELVGRLDREWAEHLSNTLQDLIGDGVRSVDIDLGGVTYVSTAGTEVLARWLEELALLRGEVRLVSVTPAVREWFAVAGWASLLEPEAGVGRRSGELRRSYWHSRESLAASGQYEMSACSPQGTLTCRLVGDPSRLVEAPSGPGDCATIDLPTDTFGLGLGAIGAGWDECHERFGELVSVAGSVAYFPSDGARKPDYLVSRGSTAPRVVLASGMTCEGGFSELIRFAASPDSDAIPLSELAAVSLEAAGGRLAGLVIVGETAGLCGARLRRSPGVGTTPVRFEASSVREWLSFAPERTCAMTTTLIAGVVARKPDGPIAAHLRLLGASGRLYGHFHAAVFSYRPLPQRTVELSGLLRGLFENHQLKDVLHLLWDDRGDAGVGESALVRGVGWVAPITQLC